MSETDAILHNYQILTEYQKSRQWVGVLAHGRYEECQVSKIIWDDMEDRVSFTTKRGDNNWNVGLPAITKLQLL